MADDTGFQPAPAPAAPVPQAPAPAPVEAPSSAPGAAGASEDGGLAEARAAMSDASPDSFLSNFLADAGLPVETGAPPVAAPAPAPAPVQQPPAGNEAPASPNVGPQQQAGVDPALLNRLLNPTAPTPLAPQPAQQWPQAPQPAPVAPVQQQQQQAAPVADALPLPFTAPFAIPDNVAQALEADDPNVRRAAIGAIVSAAGNAAFEQAVKYVQTNIAPAVAQATFGEVQRTDYIKTRDRELFGPYPHLRMASPELLQQAAVVIAQDELSRNPNAVITADTWRKVGALADAGFRQMAQGIAPVLQVPQAPAAPQVQYAPQPQPSPPPAVWNGFQWVASPQAQAAPAPAPAPFIAGQTGMPMGMPGPNSPTPESEIAAFMAGGWDLQQQ